MKRNRWIFGVAGMLFAVLGVYFGAVRLQPATLQSSAVSNLLSQSLADGKGRIQPLSQWKDKALIVNFWATWCTPCVDEMPELSQLQSEIAPVQIIGIGIDSPANIAQFAAKYKIVYPLYVGGIDGTELSRQLGNQAGGLPFTVLIGQDGKIRKTYLGRLNMQELRRDLTRL